MAEGIRPPTMPIAKANNPDTTAKGIGRPSTFSSLVDKIQERKYVKKEDIKGKEIVCSDYELENGEISEKEASNSGSLIEPPSVKLSSLIKSFSPDSNFPLK